MKGIRDRSGCVLAGPVPNRRQKVPGAFFVHQDKCSPASLPAGGGGSAPIRALVERRTKNAKPKWTSRFCMAPPRGLEPRTR